ncbi:MAG: ribosome maturation factor RimM [Chitinophagales bacterium]|nr:ribosome maturation factor RimM [Chitinophagales bacterium]
MSKNTFIAIGQLLKSVGTSGEMKVLVQDEFFEDVDQCGHFFVKNKGNYVPYFIEYFRESADLIIKIEEMDTPEAVNCLVLEPIYLPQSDIQSEGGSTSAEMTQLEQYEIYDNGQCIGKIIELQPMKHQLLATVNYQGKEIMIPIHESLIESINHDTRQINMNLPDGILEL